MADMKKVICPKCSCDRFIVTAVVNQQWQVDEDGYFMQVVMDCDAVIKKPSIYDLWTCDECGEEFVPHEEFMKNKK